jgi:hypothetical protein
MRKKLLTLPSSSVKLPPVLDLKVAPPSVEYFQVSPSFKPSTDLSCLVSLPTEDGGLYHIVADASFALEDGTQIVY